MHSSASLNALNLLVYPVTIIWLGMAPFSHQKLTRKKEYSFGNIWNGLDWNGIDWFVWGIIGGFNFFV